MRDMNIAKLTSQDLPLFLGIVQDLFPGVETPVIDYGKVIYDLNFARFSMCEAYMSSEQLFSID